MYSNDKKNGFSIIDILIKIIFAALFIFILIWLFNKKVPNMKPFYSNVFRENIRYMQEAGESYFTDERLPQQVGGTAKISLSEMFDKKLVLPFVDENGDSCNQYESYVSVTKDSKESYSLKTNLVCNNERDYTIKILGCYTYCEDGKCDKVCKREQIVKYQYKKLFTSRNTKYSCDGGYDLNGKYCYRNVISDSTSAEIKNVSTKKIVKDADVVKIPGKIEQLETISKEKRTYFDKIKKVTKPTTITKNVAYSCTKYKTENKCKTEYTSRGYSCNCTTHVGSSGKPIMTCNTCYETVPVETCNDVKVPYTDTCYRQETSVIPGKTEYSCPAGTKETESGDKCYKSTIEYSCPAGTTDKRESGNNLYCYKVTDGSIKYECKDKSYTLTGDKCIKYVKEETTTLGCDDEHGYKLEGNVCNKYTTEKIDAHAKTTTSKYYKYKWSTRSSMYGWTKTGKTKIEQGKEICE